MQWFNTHIAAFLFAPLLAFSAWFGFQGPVTSFPTGDLSSGASSTSSIVPPVACTMEAKQCPDGSWVGRRGPRCEFAACPAPRPLVAVNVYSIAPSSGEVGTTVTLRGSGFTSDNTVSFGYGAVVHVVSKDGATLKFSVPGTLNPRCYYSTPRCLIASRETTRGEYPVSVTNGNGTSNSVAFTVTAPEPQGSVTIYSITPHSGPVGTTVDITGFGFTSDNTIHFGMGAIAHVPVSSSIAVACTTDPNCRGGIRQTLEFTVPESVGPYCPPGAMCPMFLQLVTPGPYSVYVDSTTGTSNTVTFTVTSGNSGGPLSITGLDAPVSLPLGASGTWTVHVSVPDSVGQLHYSALWGDETNMAAQVMAPAPQQVQTSATFSHAYQHSGTYAATFTVTDDAGHSATVSSTISVTPLY